MKLNADEIKRIEDFLSMRESGMTTEEIAKKIGASRGNQISVACFALRLIGVKLPAIKGRPRLAGAKKRGRPVGSLDKKPRKRRTGCSIVPRIILSADQWQERLAAQGF